MEWQKGRLRKDHLGVVMVLAALFSSAWGCGGDGIDDAAQATPTAVTGTLEARSDFISAVMADTTDCWTDQFRSMGKVYDRPALILFSGMVPTSSEANASATGPFYSASDGTINIDLGFYGDLQQEYGAIGDAAQAYVIAHEIGHAVQDRLGFLGRIEAAGVHASEDLRSELWLRVELQADFYAGLAARYQGERKWLRESDIEQAIAAANVVGYGDLRQMGEGWSMPDSFTHGTLAQRVRWFTLGYESGDINRGDTFALPYAEL